MREPRNPDVNEMIGRLEKLVAATKELAPYVRAKKYARLKPVYGVRSYSESFLDNEWEIILDAMKTYTGKKAT